MNPSPSVPRSELDHRHAALLARLAASTPPIDAALIVQSVDLYYLAGTMQAATLLLPVDRAPRLLVRRVLERARAESALDDVRPFESLRNLEAELRDACGRATGRLRVGLELDVLPVSQLEVYRRALGEDVDIVDVSPAILTGRSVKSDWEIGELRRSADLAARLFARVPALYRRGMTSYELQTRLDAEARLLGHPGSTRLRGLNAEAGIGVVVSGRAGATPGHSIFPIGGEGPHTVVPGAGGHDVIERDTPVAIDYLVHPSGYHHDATRMAVDGRFPEEAEAIFATMRETLRLVESRLLPGAMPESIYEEALEHVSNRGRGDAFMGAKGYAVRFIGHGVGLEVNELPVLAPRFREPLVAGQVIAVEPKYTHPELGVIGLENTYVVRESEPECLLDFPEDVIALS